jgi:hypothetical protein
MKRRLRRLVLSASSLAIALATWITTPAFARGGGCWPEDVCVNDCPANGPAQCELACGEGADYECDDPGTC